MAFMVSRISCGRSSKGSSAAGYRHGRELPVRFMRCLRRDGYGARPIDRQVAGPHDYGVGAPFIVGVSRVCAAQRR